MVYLRPYWCNLETDELRQIVLDCNTWEAFCLHTIWFIDELGPDFQSKFTRFVAQEQRQREEKEQLRAEALSRRSSEIHPLAAALGNNSH